MVTEKLKYIPEQGKAAALVLLHLSAAFDTVDHTILIQRLEEIGIRGTANQWVASFLSGRFFQCMEAGIMSDSFSAPWGVPQGSSLSSTLFNIYLSPLAHIVQ